MPRRGTTFSDHALHKYRFYAGFLVVLPQEVLKTGLTYRMQATKVALCAISSNRRTEKDLLFP